MIKEECVTRRILSALLVVTFASMTLPHAASAGEPPKPAAPIASTLSAAIAHAVAAENKAHALQQAAAQAPAAAPSGGGLSSGSKMAIGLGVVVGAVAAGWAIAKGPDPTRWPNSPQ